VLDRQSLRHTRPPSKKRRPRGVGRFPGWVATETAEQLLDAAHVLVLTSRAEGLPVSVLEAFAHAPTVVTTDVGALPDIVVGEENGLVVTPGDTDGLAGALERLDWLPTTSCGSASPGRHGPPGSPSCRRPSAHRPSGAD
jgi:glycosyltransferase involved in cell wall biosynthesis